MSRPVVVFDSGMGGLTVLAALRALAPAADCLYVADDMAFPYGALGESELVERVVSVVDRVIGERDPAAVVIACNTASTLVLGPLRARFEVPFVGTVPAIKPAAAETRSGLVSVLATAGTVRREYTRALIAEFAGGCEVNLVAAPALVALAEARISGVAPDRAAVAVAIAPAFVEDGGRRTDVAVLACTHFPLLMPELAEAAPWGVRWIDPAPAIARRVLTVLGEAARDGSGRLEFMLTSGRAMPALAGDILAALIDTVPAGG